jgi:hypothetical protein
MNITSNNNIISNKNTLKFIIRPQKWVVNNSTIIITIPNIYILPSLSNVYCD